MLLDFIFLQFYLVPHIFRIILLSFFLILFLPLLYNPTLSSIVLYIWSCNGFLMFKNDWVLLDPTYFIPPYCSSAGPLLEIAHKITRADLYESESMFW